MSTFVYQNWVDKFLNTYVIGNLKLVFEGAITYVFRKFSNNFAYPNGAE